MLNIEFELSDLTNWISVIIILHLKCMVLLDFDIELHCVITSRDGLDIVVNVFVDLNGVDVVKVDHWEKVNEDDNASND